MAVTVVLPELHPGQETVTVAPLIAALLLAFVTFPVIVPAVAMWYGPT